MTIKLHIALFSLLFSHLYADGIAPRAVLTSYVRLDPKCHPEIQEPRILVFWEISSESDLLRFIRGRTEENDETPATPPGFKGFAFAPKSYIRIHDYSGYVIDADRPDDGTTFRLSISSQSIHTPRWHYEIANGFGIHNHEGPNLFGISLPSTILDEYNKAARGNAQRVKVVFQVHYFEVRADRKGYQDAGSLTLQIGDIHHDKNGQIAVAMPDWDALGNNFDEILKQLE